MLNHTANVIPYGLFMLNVPRLWYRKVDDTFAIISHDRGETLQKLNDFDENIEFTIEKAS